MSLRGQIRDALGLSYVILGGKEARPLDDLEKMNRPLTVMFPPRVFAVLVELAQRDGTTPSAIVRKAVLRHLDAVPERRTA